MTIIATIEPLIGGLIQEENRHYLANSPAIEPLIGGLIPYLGSEPEHLPLLNPL